MESTKVNKGVSLNPRNDEALVLLEWLSKFNEEEHTLLFQDQAERRVLFDLEAELEKVVSTTFEEDYRDILSKARKRIRDEE
jgi:hypothetical protein